MHVWFTSWGQCVTCDRSCAIEDFRQLTGMFPFAVHSAADGGEGLGQRKDFPGHQQVGILGTDRMPVDTFSCNRDFRDQVGAAESDTVVGSSTQSDPAYDPVFCGDFFRIKELTELLSFGTA